MRYGFITCVRLGEACIEELLDLGADLALLGTLTDDRARDKSGRVFLDGLSAARGIPLLKFGSINDPAAVETLQSARLDWLFIIGWSQIARQPVLSAARLGALGMHPTLLPVGRGRASVPWAIIKGLPETGVSMFKLEEGTDTGPILMQVPIPIEPTETSTTLYAKVTDAHRQLIRDSFAALESGDPELVTQDESKATEWPRRKPTDGELDLTTMSAADVDRHVRALTRPYPGAFLRNNDGRVTRLWAGQVYTGATTPDCGLRLETADGVYLAADVTYDDA